MNERMRIWGTLLHPRGCGRHRLWVFERAYARAIEGHACRTPNPMTAPRLASAWPNRQVENADKLYAAGKSEEAVAAIHDVVSYPNRRRQAADQSGQPPKNIEIAVQRMARRLTDIKRRLPFDDQATVQAAIERLDKIDSDLLNRMFGKNPK